MRGVAHVSQTAVCCSDFPPTALVIVLWRNPADQNTVGIALAKERFYSRGTEATNVDKVQACCRGRGCEGCVVGPDRPAPPCTSAGALRLSGSCL